MKKSEKERKGRTYRDNPPIPNTRQGTRLKTSERYVIHETTQDRRKAELSFRSFFFPH